MSTERVIGLYKARLLEVSGHTDPLTGHGGSGTKARQGSCI